MENQFTFLESPEVTALNHALELMPGLKQVELFVNDDFKKEMSLLRLQENREEIERIELLPTSLIVSKSFFDQQNNLAWYQNSDLPYFDENFERTNNDLFTELDKNILIVPIKSIDHLPKLFYIFHFRKNASELGPVSSGNILHTSHKQLLGRLLFNSLKTLLHSTIENRKLMLEYNTMFANMIRSKEIEIERRLEKTKEYSSILDAVVFNILKDLKNENEEVIIPDKSKLIIYPHLTHPDRLKKHLKKALNFARTFQFLQVSPKMELLPDYFSDLENQKQEEIKASKSDADVYSTHTKTYQFLQSLENAANRLMQRGEKLTSIKVGQELEQPVTAAAISDKLKNHAYKIHLLLKQFPQKWPVVRNQFRPVINIQEKQSREKFAS